MYLHLVRGRGGSLLAEHYIRDVGKALAIAERLESAGPRPNIVRSNANYVVYIATADLLRLAERDGAVRRAVALYLAEKERHAEAEGVCRKNPEHPFFHRYVLENAVEWKGEEVVARPGFEFPGATLPGHGVQSPASQAGFSFGR